MNRDKKMLSQAEKISQVTHQLNVYLEEIGTTEILTEAHVNNKVDSSEAKGRKLYKKYFKNTTGSGNDNGGDIDLVTTYAQWSNFRTYHEVITKCPTWGPCSC